MTKESNHRRPRKVVPEDVVSCPPTLNLSKTSGKRGRLLLDELKKTCPQLAEIEEFSKETDADDSTTVISARFQSEVSSLATNDAPSAFKESIALKPKPRNLVENSSQRPYKTSHNRTSNQPWPLPDSGGDLSTPQQRDRLQRFDDTTGTGPRPTTRQHFRQHEEISRNQLTRPRNQSRKSAYSSARSSMNSSMVSWDTMSQSAYSIYTTASTIARRPAWGHYVVGFMVFVGWLLHHWYFSEYFVPSSYAGRGMDTSHSALTYGGIHSANLLPLADDAKPSMLRGAIYRTQDMENRNDFAPIRSAASAFDVIEGERPDRDEGKYGGEANDARNENDASLSDSLPKNAESTSDGLKGEVLLSPTVVPRSKEGETS